MCGIAGAVDHAPERARRRVQRINQRQRHRGPDHEALVTAGPFTLGNTRLAIQDPTPAGNQPFWSADGRFVCVFNGEIYNYRELIQKHGVQLQNRCDGALIPELWSRLGPACLAQFRGMYAIAIADTTSSTLTLCRDPFGIKPLYTRRLADGTLAFGSEVRPLALIDELPKLNIDAVAQFLRLGALQADVSPFDGIDAVPPNTVMTLDHEGRSTSAPIFPGRHPLFADGSGSDGPADLGPVLVESVDLHLRSDVPVVLLLSAGVDSTAIASAARRRGHDLHCMTVDGIGDTDESGAAAATAAQYGHKHEVVRAEIGDDEVQEFFRAMQRPTIDGLNTFIVCRAIQRSGYRVALSGLGGDEALGGYAHFRLRPLLGWLKAADHLPFFAPALSVLGPRLPRLNSDKARRLVQHGGPRTSQGLTLLQREVYSPGAVRELTGIDVAHGRDSHLADDRSFQALVEAEVALYMQSTLLPDADGFSMCSSVELRVPFVDREFFGAALRAQKAGRPQGKASLARSLEDPYLSELCRRPKSGFSVPMAAWLESGPLKAAVQDLDRTSAPVWDVLRRPSARGSGTTGNGRWAEQWSLAVLNQWLSTF